MILLAVTPACSILDKRVVGVERIGRDQVDSEVEQNALSGKQPSSTTLETLHYFGLTESYEKDPDEALIELHRAVLAEPERPFLHALAELAYLRARSHHDRDEYLAAAAYAWLYLLGERDLEPASPYDRRFRWTCDLYNRSLREAFMSDDDDELHLDGGQRKLPVGTIDVEVDIAKVPPAKDGVRYVPADNYSVWGLSVRVRDSGIGTPLVVVREKPKDDGPLSRFLPKKRFVPSTLLMRVSGGLAGMEHGLHATLELHSTFDPSEVSVDGRTVPLESDFSTALALALETSSIWDFSTRGFWKGEESKGETRLVAARPPTTGLVPVVFVHGTASNPGYWAEMFNLLLAERAIREHMQFWFFQYPTGSPIAFSAGILRKQITDLVTTLDPEGKDPALKQIVVIGHSQGGLLAKLMAVDSNGNWWDKLVGKPLEELEFPPDQEEIVRSAMDFKAVPGVKRVVFLATPHRGSYQADHWLTRFVAKTIALPGELVGVNESLVKNAGKLPKDLQARIPTSLDNMRASNPFLQLLCSTPLAAGVKAHSIIAIDDGDPAHPEEASDGIVKYSSAHIEGVESELLVPTGHSCQADPRSIAEVRRILLLHLRESGVLPKTGAAR